MALPQPPLPSPPLQLPSHIFSPILIAMLGITTIGSLLLIYHFISSKFPHPSPPTWLHHQQPPEASGLDQCILDHIPIHDYKPGVGSFHLDHTECAVCLSEVEEGEHVRVLPDCRHVFHVQCIDQWFASHSNCPLCRSPIVSAPVADVLHVPLIEVVAGGGQGEVRAEPGSRGYGGLHRDFASLKVCEGIVQPVVVGGLKRSLSMDVSVRVRSDILEEVAASSSSSSSVWFLKKSHSQKRFDRASSMLVRSLSRLRMGNDGGASGSLPR